MAFSESDARRARREAVFYRSTAVSEELAGTDTQRTANMAELWWLRLKRLKAHPGWGEARATQGGGGVMAGKRHRRGRG